MKERLLSRIAWPDEARMALQIRAVIEMSVGPVHTPFMMATPFPKEDIDQGKRDIPSLEWAEYGARVGIWRILSVLDRHNVKATVSVSGVVGEKYPEVVRRLRDGGHEIVGHSYAHNIMTYRLDRSQERENIIRTVKALEDASGERPVGWASPRCTPSENTLELLMEENFLWCGDCHSTDLPYIVENRDRQLVMIAHEGDVNDLQQYVRSGNPPSSYVEGFKRAFDTLYKEAWENPTIMCAVVHAHVFGRPFGISALESVLSYAKSFPDVWWARGVDIAKRTLSEMRKN